MITPLAVAITAVSGLGALAVAGAVTAGTYRWVRVAPALATVELALLGQAAADVLGLARGDRPSEPGTHLAYLVTSLLVLPVAGVQVRGDDDRWSGSVIAAALLVVAVVVVRMAATWRAA